MAIPFLSPIGNINISDGTPQLKLTDSSSSATTTLTLDGVNLTLQNNGTDGDFTIIGKDGSSYINLLAFDTSEGGNATFVGTVTWSGGGSANANTAYGWGNHASGGYAPLSSPSFSGNVTISGAISAGSNGGIRIHSSGTKFFNVTAANAAQDATMDVGASDARFKDAYFSGTVTAAAFTGTASNANLLDNIDSNQFAYYNALTFADGTELTSRSGTFPAPGRTTTVYPANYGRTLNLEFKSKATMNSPGTGSSWLGIMSMAPYATGTSFYTTQIAMGADGTNADLYIRRGNGTGNGTWGSWRQIITADSATFTDSIYMGNTVLNPVSGFADQTGIGLKYSTTVPEIQVSSDSTAMQLGRTSTGGSGQIMAMRAASTTVHDFRTTYYSTTGWVDAANFKIGGAQGADGQVLTSTGSGVAWEASSATFTGGTVANATTFSSNVTFTGQILTPSGVNLALNPNTGLVTVGGIIQCSGTGVSSFAGNVTMTRASAGDTSLTIKTTSGGDPTVVFNSAAANRSGMLTFQDNGTQTGQIAYRHNGDALEFYTGGASTSGHLELRLKESEGATFRTQVNAPIFYDSGATSYYVDPGTTSRLGGSLAVGGASQNANSGVLDVKLTQSNGALGAAHTAHFGNQAHTNGQIMGITLGYKEHVNESYRKIGLVAAGRGDGAARQDFHILVDTVSDSGSVNINDSKLKIDGLTGLTTIAGNVSHGGLTPTAGTDIDQIYTASVSLTVTTAWQDTTVNAAELATGTYIVQVYTDDHGTNSIGHYTEYYSGIMSWYSTNTNSTDTDEIILHRAGHAPNHGDIFLRTERTASADTSDMNLQIKTSNNASGAATYVFKFRRMI